MKGRGVLVMVTVKIITRTYSYSPVSDEIMLDNIEVMFVRTSAIDALDLVAETNSIHNEDDEYVEFKSGFRKLVTTHAVIL